MQSIVLTTYFDKFSFDRFSNLFSHSELQFFSLWLLVLHLLFSEEFPSIYPKPGIHEPRGPEADRSAIFKILLILVRYRIFKFCSVLDRPVLVRRSLSWAVFIVFPKSSSKLKLLAFFSFLLILKFKWENESSSFQVNSLNQSAREIQNRFLLGRTNRRTKSSNWNLEF